MGNWEQAGEDRLRIDVRSRWTRVRETVAAFGPGFPVMITIFALTYRARRSLRRAELRKAKTRLSVCTLI